VQAANIIGFVFLPQKAQNAQNPSYSLVIKELAIILPILILALFFKLIQIEPDLEGTKVHRHTGT
jgi:hypothetical protein